MSSQQPDNIFDLEQHFLPAWAKQSPAENRFANYEGEPERRGGRDRDRDRRRERRDRPPPRRDQAQDRGPGGAPYPRRRDGRGREDWRRDDGGRPRFERADRPPPPPPEPLPDLNLAFVPDDKGVESLARQIKATGRAYPLFDIAQMILAKPERHHVTFSVVKNAEGVVANPMYLCALDETLWLSEAAAMQHLLDRHFTTFYQPERTQVEAPKGTYTFVAQCGMSGVILGPPNHHDYQNQLRKLHAERFSRMPFDVFKSRVKIVREEAVVKKWIEDQSYKTHYVCLNMPEPLTLHCREEVESHFRETHLPNLVQSVETHRMSGTASRNLHESALRRLVRQAWEDQRRFPIQVATVLSQQFAASGLQFFKVNRTVTHVAVARPHYLDLDITPVSESIRQIVNYINANPKCTHNQLLEALAPMPGADESTEPTPERTAVVADLHWLVHEGHVIEFANGVLETAKKPLPKPPPKTAPAAGTAAATTETDACAPAAAETAGAAAGASTAAAPPEPAPPAAATESASLAVSAEPTQPTDPPEPAPPAAATESASLANAVEPAVPTAPAEASPDETDLRKEPPADAQAGTVV